MKRMSLMALCMALLWALAACQGGEALPDASRSSESLASNSAANGKLQSTAMALVLNQTEYVLYQNIFYNDMAEEYVGKTSTKEGILTRMYDAFADRTRCYVWGYSDATKCCDWQWEFLCQDPDSLPANGSLVRMTGVLTRDEQALDKLWFTEASVELKQAFVPEACDIDMTTMGPTLELVQLLNMQYQPERFSGKSLRLYGRVLSPTEIQHPYADNAWVQPFETQAEVPAIGSMVILTGLWKGDKVQAQQVEPMPDD